MENPESAETILEIIELEEYARDHGLEAPKAKQYAFRVDKWLSPTRARFLT